MACYYVSMCVGYFYTLVCFACTFAVCAMEFRLVKNRKIRFSLPPQKHLDVKKLLYRSTNEDEIIRKYQFKKTIL